MGKWLIVFGVLLIIAGILVRMGIDFSWIGNLPGDIRFKSGNTEIYIPIVTCLLFSLLFSLIIYIVKWLS